MSINKNSPLTILSYGAGQDSTTILYKILHDPEFKERYVSGQLILVMGNTENEHPATYKHVEYTKKLCKQHNIPFFILGSKYRSDSWKGGLEWRYDYSKSFGSISFGKSSCTDQLKIQPIYKFLNDYIFETFGIGEAGAGKKAIHAFGKKYGKFNVLIGIAKGEDDRIFYGNYRESQWKYWINNVYPLYEIGMDRSDCQNYIQSLGYDVPMPSACLMCHFSNSPELIYLERFYPETFEKWEQIEINKRNNFRWKGGSAFSIYEKSTGQLLSQYGSRESAERQIEIIVEKKNAKLKLTESPSLFDDDNYSSDDFYILEEFLPEDINLTAGAKGTGKIAFNAYIKGLHSLREELELAKEKHSEMSDEDLVTYRMSHGHCVNNKM